MNFNFQTDKQTNVVNGKYGVYTIEAKMNHKPIIDGIANGRVYELSVYCGGIKIIHYDRGWKRGHNFVSLIQTIVKQLEQIKTSRIHRVKKLVGSWL